MPNWSTDIPDDPRGHGLPLIRCPAQTTLEAIVTCDNLIGCDTHFWAGHTVPCTKPECDPCTDGNRWTWHAYLSAYDPKSDEHFIFECTQRGAMPFKEYFRAHHSLRGCQFQAYRWKRAKNGRVQIKCTPTAFNHNLLPKPPILQNVMAIIWKLPMPNTWVAGAEHGHPRIHADPDLQGQSTRLGPNGTGGT